MLHFLTSALHGIACHVLGIDVNAVDYDEVALRIASLSAGEIRPRLRQLVEQLVSPNDAFRLILAILNVKRGDPDTSRAAALRAAIEYFPSGPVDVNVPSALLVYAHLDFAMLLHLGRATNFATRELTEATRAVLVARALALIDSRREKDAANLAATMGVADRVPLERILLPLIASRTLGACDRLCTGNRERQQVYARLLDAMCSRDDQATQALFERHNLGRLYAASSLFTPGSKALKAVSNTAITLVTTKMGLDDAQAQALVPLAYRYKDSRALHYYLNSMYDEDDDDDAKSEEDEENEQKEQDETEKEEEEEEEGKEEDEEEKHSEGEQMVEDEGARKKRKGKGRAKKQSEPSPVKNKDKEKEKCKGAQHQQSTVANSKSKKKKNRKRRSEGCQVEEGESSTILRQMPLPPKENWLELIRLLMRDQPWVAPETVDYLHMRLHDDAAAVFFARTFGVTAAQLPHWSPSLDHFLTLHPPFSASTHSTTTATTTTTTVATDFFDLPFPLEGHVFFVDGSPSSVSLEQVFARLLVPGTIVAFDCEWQPSGFSRRKHPPVALMQLALADTVFLLDTIALAGHPVLVSGLRQLFAMHSVLKIGFGIHEDVKLIARLCQGRQKKVFQPRMSSCIDLMDVCNHCAVTRSKSAGQKTGLAARCHRHLGVHIDKSEQMSDWERRPLRLAQVRYAAIDAFVLLRLFDAADRQQATEVSV